MTLKYLYIQNETYTSMSVGCFLYFIGIILIPFMNFKYAIVNNDDSLTMISWFLIWILK